MSKEQAALLKKANVLKEEIKELANHIEESRQFQGEDIYDVLIGASELILAQRQRELSKIISQIEEVKPNSDGSSVSTKGAL